jgi:hypothetical protein
MLDGLSTMKSPAQSSSMSAKSPRSTASAYCASSRRTSCSIESRVSVPGSAPWLALVSLRADGLSKFAHQGRLNWPKSRALPI